MPIEEFNSIEHACSSVAITTINQHITDIPVHGVRYRVIRDGNIRFEGNVTLLTEQYHNLQAAVSHKSADLLDIQFSILICYKRQGEYHTIKELLEGCACTEITTNPFDTNEKDLCFLFLNRKEKLD